MGRGFETALPVVKSISTDNDPVEHTTPTAVMSVSLAASAGPVFRVGMRVRLFHEVNELYVIGPLP